MPAPNQTSDKRNARRPVFRRGLTPVEAVAAIMVISILVIIAVPAFRKIYSALIKTLALITADPSEEGASVSKKAVSFVSADGFTIIGAYYMGLDNNPGVVLLHMLNKSKESWKDLAARLHQKGFHVLAIDFRGQGHSLIGPKGKRLTLQKLNPEQVHNIVEDAAGAAFWLMAQPGVDQARIAMVGASIGANAALVAATGKGPAVRTLVLLSPGEDYRGIQTMDAAKAYTGSALYVVAEGDGYSADSVKKLCKVAGGGAVQLLYGGSGHGTDMLTAQPDLPPLILTWLTEHLE